MSLALKAPVRVQMQDPQTEVMARTLARRRLLHFTTYTYSHYVPEPAHELICEHLEAVLRGEIKRLMIFAPPQHGKTELVSVRFPAFWLAHRPDDFVILTSYSGGLAQTKSGEARQVVESDEYKGLFPGIEMDRASRARALWKLEGRRGGMLAAGVAGGITGYGASLGIIDDPFESWEKARSATIRNKTWEWWRATFRTRIRQGGAVVMIMTRWHEDDLAGRLLRDQKDKWTVLRLPAIAETQEERDENDRRLGLPLKQKDPLNRVPGEALCPARFRRKTLLEIKGDVGIMAWVAEYQGVPRDPEGNRFKRDWFPIADAVPVEAKRVRYWDKGGWEGEGAYTAGVLIAVTAEGEIYIEHVVRGQWSAGKREQVLKDTTAMDADRYGREAVPVWIEQEPGTGGKESAESTIRNLAGYVVRADRPMGNKDARLEPFAVQAQAGNVHVVRGNWNWDYVEEMISIPTGTFRDQGDATSGAYNMLMKASGWSVGMA